MTVLALIARILAPLARYLPFLGVWLAARRDARLGAENEALQSTINAERLRDEISTEIDRNGGARDRLREKWGRK